MFHRASAFPSCEQFLAATKKRPSLMDHPVVKEVTAKYPGATPANILLNWGLSRGTSVIPKSVNAGTPFRTWFLSASNL